MYEALSASLTTQFSQEFLIFPIKIELIFLDKLKITLINEVAKLALNAPTTPPFTTPLLRCQAKSLYEEGEH